MTLHELTHQIYTLPYNMPCYINDVKRTSCADVERLFRAWLLVDHKSDCPKAQYIFQIGLPDGRWYCKAIRDGNYYDLYVPDTREQEQRLKDQLFNR